MVKAHQEDAMAHLIPNPVFGTAYVSEQHLVSDSSLGWINEDGFFVTVLRGLFGRV
jgi:hypothetical protein